MTEDEAKTKMCCGPPGQNAMAAGLHVNAEVVETFCTASACMAWRWEHKTPVAASRKFGFCGLAGRP